MDKKLDELYRIRVSAIFLHSCLGGPDIGENLSVQAKLEELVDEFRLAFPEHITDAHAQRAVKDIEFFLSLIAEAVKAYKSAKPLESN